MELIKVSEKNGVKEILLNRPQVRNAFSPKMISELTQAFKSTASDKSIRMVVLRGEGSVFCAGADLQWMQEMVNFTLEQNEKDSLELYELFQALYEIPVPVLGVAQGAVFGGALGLLAACDFVVAGEKTQFCFSEVKLGLAPAVISTFILRKIPQAHVRPWMISGKVFDAETAARMGLVTNIIDEERLQEGATEIIHALLQAAPEATRETKKLLNSVLEKQFPDIKAATAKLISERRVSKEGQEGLKAFLSKGTPSWRKP